MTEKPPTRDIPLTPDIEKENAIMTHLEKKMEKILSEELFLEVKPFPYMVIENFLPDKICSFIESEGRNLDTMNASVHSNSKKMAEHKYWTLNKEIRDCLSVFYSDRFVKFLEKITGIEGLIADADYNWGGGYHLLPKGGFLNVHKDFNIHPHMQLHRRLNLLIYLNRNWTKEDGGQLEFWDMKTKTQIASIVPSYNLGAMFETSEISYHGNPNKVTRSDGYGRLAYNLYYYTKTRPGAIIEEHTTVYVDTPGQYVNRIRSIAGKLVPDPIRKSLMKLIRRV